MRNSLAVWKGLWSNQSQSGSAKNSTAGDLMSKLLVVGSLVLALAVFAGCGSSSKTTVDPGTPEVSLTLHPEGACVFMHGNKRGADAFDQFENHTPVSPDHVKKQGVDVIYRGLGQPGLW